MRKMGWLLSKNLKLYDGSRSRKLQPKYSGPFEIRHKINPATFELELSEPMKARRMHNKFNVSLLKPFVDVRLDRKPSLSTSLILDDGHEDGKLKIFKERNVSETKHYLFTWRGLDHHENTRLPTENLENAKDATKSFHVLSRRLT